VPLKSLHLVVLVASLPKVLQALKQVVKYVHCFAHTELLMVVALLEKH
jgi:hypothetical protein